MNEILQVDLDDDSFPVSPTPNIKTNYVAYMIINRSDISTAYTDLTGQFPCKSISGNEYVMVAYHYNGNTIIGCPLKKYEQKILLQRGSLCTIC